MLPNSISVSNAILNSVCGNPLLVGTKCLLPLSKALLLRRRQILSLVFKYFLALHF